jgi:hypothetical protein
MSTIPINLITNIPCPLPWPWPPMKNT